MARSTRMSKTRAKKTSDAKVMEKVARVIEVPKEVLALNVGKLQKAEEIPEITAQWANEYAFQLATFNISFVTSRGEDGDRGIKLVNIDGNFEKSEVNVMDVLPKTEWVAKDYSAEFSFSLDPLGVISKVVEPVDGVKVPTGVTAGLTFKYNWNPKAARVIAGGAEGGVHWYSEHAQNQYLDGNYQVSIMFSHPKNLVGPFKLEMKLLALHDIAGDTDQYTDIKKTVEIKVKV